MNENHEHLFQAQKAMADAIARMDAIKGKVGLASQIVEFATDRAKSALAVVVVEYLKQDMSIV